MLLDRIDSVDRYLRKFILERYNIDLPRLVVETPPQIEMGDLAFPFPFELARVLKRAPLQIARDVVEEAQVPQGVSEFRAAGAGYVNVFLNRVLYLKELKSWLDAPAAEPAGGKIIVEHTNINPNKAAHIGHLRNAVLGDAFVRLLKFRGRLVETQNYIDNTGVQVADVVVGFEHLRGLSLEEVRQIPEPFDHYCWDLYAEVSEWYEKDLERQKLRHQALSRIESGEGPTAELAEHISSRIVQAHLQTMQRIGVFYDVLPRESEILHLKFWDTAFEKLRETGAIEFRDSGANAGCWVMFLPEENGQPEDEKIIVRSNGTVTYVGKDIAYQLWKFGLLGKTFHYRVFYTYPQGKEVWMTSTDKEPTGGSPDFGSGSRVYNVIDVRQSYLQRVVVRGLRSLGHEDEAAKSVHFSYEMVALTPKCCSEMGIALPPEVMDKPYVEVSGRKGLGVKADDLIDTLIEKSSHEVNSRQQDLSDQDRNRIATQIAVGALRYFLLKYTRNSVIAFDFSEALSFEGETGPYLQYSLVRANNIFRKLSAQEPSWDYERWSRESVGPVLDGTVDVSVLIGNTEIWELLLLISRVDNAMEQAEKNLEMSHLAKHAFTLAQQFNLFYHRHHILSEKDRLCRDFYLLVVDLLRKGLLQAMGILGIEAPERM